MAMFRQKQKRKSSLTLYTYRKTGLTGQQSIFMGIFTSQFKRCKFVGRASRPFSKSKTEKMHITRKVSSER